ncbi:MAG: M18 family aminopeptidase [Rothia sp. (in: high G+C Gram-positive bacteria)]|uniref:M18 family aminopeptidase n=1 Tax=Rothia sp. (in: high G+C Gram-positive bacteria) TaxID=1885016 RepID=UPI0026DEE732|nr:M18 family aminopeptidase [Rothia sp. (in: high G+C Gram-positive bacteria)]MDO5750469.1 M18 family aminopeptidase [Rothia sp. (in: high G+C Gram-positive bacteria)]
MSVDAIKNIEDLAQFVKDSPVSYLAARTVARRLQAAGFTELQENDAWDSQVAYGRHYVIRDGAVIAWAGGRKAEKASGYRVLGAHTDSPALKIKPQPSVSFKNWNQIAVENYGGALLNSLLDRELRVAGRLTVLQDGKLVDRYVATGPLARVPQLAPHLDTKRNDLSLDRQFNMYPIWGANSEDSSLLGYLTRQTIDGGEEIAEEDIVGYDLFTVDSQDPRRFGEHEEFFASGRLDNLSSVHAGLCALERYVVDNADEQAHDTAMLAAFDHEEIGSGSRSGAAGPFLEDVLVRLSAARGESPEEYRRSLADSFCLSADAGHLVHPNYSSHHDPNVQPLPGHGPLLKINANQRYATDSVGSGVFVAACRAAEVPYQEFVSNNNTPCGSTIGPITATRLGMRTVDVGIGLLSMHSMREMCHVEDMAYMTRMIEAFYRLPSVA